MLFVAAEGGHERAEKIRYAIHAITQNEHAVLDRITVEDDGPGIPIEVRNNLFEPGVSTKSGGWGIGLALARRIVEDVHGGQLELASTEGGATFVAKVPTAGDAKSSG